MSQADSTSGNNSDQLSDLTNNANPIPLVRSQPMNDQSNNNQDSNADKPAHYFEELLSRLDACTELVLAE